MLFGNKLLFILFIYLFDAQESFSAGLNLRVTGHCNQGGRKYMEDVFSVAYQQTEDELDLEYAFFGIYDGHGGKEAALFAKVPLNATVCLAPIVVYSLGSVTHTVPLKPPRSLPTVLTGMDPVSVC
jgi:hypothetical protein